MIWDSISDLLPGLLPASYRGVRFDVPDTSIEAGRRIVVHLFPGLDAAAYDDMGLAPQIITIDGLVLGDDYIAQAQVLEAAFETPGPGTLIHPWLGVMLVMQEGAARISFSSSELRVARFSVSFTRVGSGGGLIAGLSPAFTLVSAASTLMTSALGLIQFVGDSSLSQLGINALVRSNRLTGAAFAVVRELGIASLATVFDIIPADGTAFYTNMISIIDETFDAIPEWGGISPVAPAEEAPALSVSDDIISPVKAVDSFLSITGNLIAEAVIAPSPIDTAILISAAIMPFAAALKLSTVIEFEARDSAIELRNRFRDISGALEEVLVGLSNTLGVGATSDLMLRLSAANVAANADLNEAIGRLPRVLRLQIETEVDAYLIANHYYGDTPGVVEEGYEVLVKRNRPRHPAALAPGLLEILS